MNERKREREKERKRDRGKREREKERKREREKGRNGDREKGQNIISSSMPPFHLALLFGMCNIFICPAVVTK